MVGGVVWGIERQVKAVLSNVSVPRQCPWDLLFVPKSIHPAVLRWGHSSKLVVHPGVRRTLAAISQCFGGPHVLGMCSGSWPLVLFALRQSRVVLLPQDYFDLFLFRLVLGLMS